MTDYNLESWIECQIDGYFFCSGLPQRFRVTIIVGINGPELLVESDEPFDPSLLCKSLRNDAKDYDFTSPLFA